MPDDSTSRRLLTGGELARALGVSRSAVLKWTTANPPLIKPAFTTPGGHHRYYEDDVRAQLDAAREAGRDTDASS